MIISVACTKSGLTNYGKTHEGSIGYTVEARTPAGKIVHAGYFTYPTFWNNGYVTEAFRKVLEFAFLEDGVYRVTTGCADLYAYTVNKL